MKKPQENGDSTAACGPYCCSPYVWRLRRTAESQTARPSKRDAPAEFDSSGAPADAPQALTLPILDEIDADVAVGTAGSSLLAVQAAVKLLDWGREYGLLTRMRSALPLRMAERKKNDDRPSACKSWSWWTRPTGKPLTDEAREPVLDSAGADVEIIWGQRAGRACGSHQCARRGCGMLDSV